MSEFEDMRAGSEGEDDILAAEYVLGVLAADDRRALERRMEAEAEFASRVAAWQARLSGMDAAYAEVEPPARLLPTIEARLFASPRPEGWVTRAWNSLALWRGFTAASVLGLLALALVASGIIGPAPQPQAQYVATLESAEGGTEVVALYDPAARTVRISGHPAELPADAVFELWFAVGQDAPVSLGLLPREGSIELSLAAERMSQLASEADRPSAHFGISLEPLGGSPTGAPTGPVLVVGDLRRI